MRFQNGMAELINRSELICKFALELLYLIAGQLVLGVVKNLLAQILQEIKIVLAKVLICFRRSNNLGNKCKPGVAPFVFDNLAEFRKRIREEIALFLYRDQKWVGFIQENLNELVVYLVWTQLNHKADHVLLDSLFLILREDFPPSLFTGGVLGKQKLHYGFLTFMASSKASSAKNLEWMLLEFSRIISQYCQKSPSVFNSVRTLLAMLIYDKIGLAILAKRRYKPVEDYWNSCLLSIDPEVQSCFRWKGKTCPTVMQN